MELLSASFLNGILLFFVKGGIFMAVLMALSVVAGTVIIMRATALRERNVLPPALYEEIERLQPDQNLDRLHTLIEENPSALARVLEILLSHLTWPRAEVIEAVQTKARQEVARLEKGLVILEIATGVAPLLGLLGTLSGLVSIFDSIGSDPILVARGIAEALNTTIVGLAVAAPCLTAHNYFQRRVEVMAIEMESLVADLIAKCYPEGAAPTIQKISK